MMRKFWLELYRGKVFRRISLIWMMWLTTTVYYWVFEYLNNAGDVSFDVAALVAAILSPISALQAAVFKFYSTSTYGNEELKDG
jgi:hypothetical protein